MRTLTIAMCRNKRVPVVTSRLAPTRLRVLPRCRPTSRRSSVPKPRPPPRSGPRIYCSLTRPCSSSMAMPGSCSKRTSWPSTRSSSGLFSGAGGRFILYRPGMPPIDAPSVPIVYQLLKSVGHSTMALAEVVVPYLNSPNDLTWRGPVAAYRNRMQSALDGLDAVPIRDDWRPITEASCRTTSRSWTSA